MTTIHTPGAPYEPIALPNRTEVTAPERAQRAEAFFENMAKRHTVRDFAPTPVPQRVIAACIATAGRAPSGANHQPWHFCAVSDAGVKKRLRDAAEAQERAFYEGRAGEKWLEDLTPLGTNSDKSFLEIAPWVIVVFAERYGIHGNGESHKNYYVQESAGIATGFLLAALHHAGLSTLSYTPAPMGFLSEICARPENERPYMVIVAGLPAEDATIPKKSTVKKSLDEVASFL